MSSLLRPVGHLPASVYWVRRALVLAVLVALVVLLLRMLGGGDDPENSAAAGPGATPNSAPTSTPTSAGPSPSGGATSTATPTSATGSPDRTGTPSAPVDDGRCDGREVRINVLPASRAIKSGTPLTLSVRLSAAREQCTATIDPSRLSVTITSGKDRIWTTTHCEQAISRATLVLAKGKESASVVVWNGHRSRPSCLPGQPVAKPGTYVVQAVYDGRASIEQAFHLT